MPVPGRIAAALTVLGAVVGGGVLYSCDDLPITIVTFRVDDPWTFAVPALPLMVEVRGQPGLDAGAVAATMQRAISWYANPRLTEDPAVAGHPSTRLVMTFNPASPGGGEANCDGRLDGGEFEADAPLRLLASFCAGTRVLANVEGRLRRSGDGSGPIEALLRQVTLELFRGPRHP
ncbi:MAG: hypothetical protein MUD06_05010 [Rhodospirillales bacterium]|jgi:hypothetical protein|nr:hypothetical protein [Rhodospirillales bacterium]